MSAKKATVAQLGDNPPIHPAASIFPMLSDAELNVLAEDIKTNGLHEEIVTFKGQVIDGRNRLEGCRRAGLPPRYREWDGEGSLVGWILSANLHRRHLTNQQRAMVAARAKEQFEAEAQDRKIANIAKNKGSVDGLDRGHRSEGRSSEKAAIVLNVSRAAVEKAVRVQEQGDEMLKDAVMTGKVSLDAAAAVAVLPKAEQRKLVTAGKVKEAAKKLRKAKVAKKAPKLAQPELEPTAAPPEPVEVADPTPSTIEPGPTEVATEPPYPLALEAYQAIDAMVAVGQQIASMTSVDTLLRNIISACKKIAAKLEAERMNDEIDRMVADSVAGPSIRRKDHEGADAEAYDACEDGDGEDGEPCEDTSWMDSEE